MLFDVKRAYQKGERENGVLSSVLNYGGYVLHHFGMSRMYVNDRYAGGTNEWLENNCKCSSKVLETFN